jgi:hypothetical protein
MNSIYSNLTFARAPHATREDIDALIRDARIVHTKSLLNYILGMPEAHIYRETPSLWQAVPFTSDPDDATLLPFALMPWARPEPTGLDVNVAPKDMPAFIPHLQAFLDHNILRDKGGVTQKALLSLSSEMNKGCGLVVLDPHA